MKNACHFISFLFLLLPLLLLLLSIFYVKTASRRKKNYNKEVVQYSSVSLNILETINQ